MHHVVVLGAGFAGLHVARSLRKAPVRVTLVDQHNYHQFQPLYYQVATAGLEPAEIAHNVRDILQGAQNVDFRMGAVVGIDRATRRVTFAEGPELHYDVLVVATGAVTSYYGVEGAREHGFPLKSLEDSVRLRNHVLAQFERYSLLGEAAGAGALTFVVVGGGATGVELCGALVELFRIPLRRDYKAFDATEAARVILLERTDHLLTAYPENQRQYTRRVLERRGVEVRTGVAVARVEPDAVVLDSGERIPTSTLVWAAGVEASPVARLLDTALTRDGRLVVSQDLSVPGAPEIFAIGDVAGFTGVDEKLLPQLAPVAIQQGKHVARQISRRLHNLPAESFRYRDKGTMATIGRNAAVAELFGRIHFKGLLAWLAWVFLHLIMLVGFRNRANVFINWVYSYFTYDRGARLILTPEPRKNPGEGGS